MNLAPLLDFETNKTSVLRVYSYYLLAYLSTLQLEQLFNDVSRLTGDVTILLQIT